MNEKKLIVFSAGGTGGHLFPAISLSDCLDKNAYSYFFLTDERCEFILKKNKLNYKKIDAGTFNKKKIFWFQQFYKIIRGLITCLIYFIKEKPSLVIGFGGYVSFPAILSARLLGIKIVIHEQNCIMGKANRILSKFADFIALNYKETKYAPKKNIIVTGIPVRKDFLKKKLINHNYSRKKILVIGGSQGAKIFSSLIPKIIMKLSKKDLKKLEIIQQAPKDDILKIKKTFKEMKVKFKVKNFFHNIAEEMKVCDIIISRCGASTLAEIEKCKKKSILFPLISAKDNHQALNAKEFSKYNQCVVIDEMNINYMQILDIIRSIIYQKKLEKNTKQLRNKTDLQSLIERII